MNRKKKLWMVPLSILLMAGGLMCLWMLRLSFQFMLPVKAETTQMIEAEPAMDRDDFIWIPPPPPEPEPEPEPEPYQLQVDLANVQSYHNYNTDVIGWIRIKDTAINYPIMQSGDNEFYVDHTWQGQPSHAGAIFADFRCAIEGTDNTLIYGHNMANGSMLHAIKNYKVEEWGRAHQYIEVASLTHRYLYKVLSVNVVYGEWGAAFEYWNYIDMNRASYRDYYENIRNTALVWYGDDSDPPKDNEDRIIALQTCNSGANDGIRCLVFAQCIGDFTDIPTYMESSNAAEPRMEPPA